MIESGDELVSGGALSGDVQVDDLVFIVLHFFYTYNNSKSNHSTLMGFWGFGGDGEAR